MDQPLGTPQRISQKLSGSAWDLCELYLIEKAQDSFGRFSATDASRFARPLMTVGHPIQAHGPHPRPRPTSDDRFRPSFVDMSDRHQAVDGRDIQIDAFGLTG